MFFILFYRRLYVIENGAADGNVKQLYTAVDSLVFPPHLNNTAAARRELYSWERRLQKNVQGQERKEERARRYL